MGNGTVTDWKGNEIKAGDFICLIKIKDVKNRQEIWWPGQYAVDEQGELKNHRVQVTQEREEVDCFEVGEYYQVFEFMGQPGIHIVEKLKDKEGEFRYTDTLFRYMTLVNHSTHVLGIKGVSDFK